MTSPKRPFLDSRAATNGTAETSIKYVPLTSAVHNPAQPLWMQETWRDAPAPTRKSAVNCSACQPIHALVRHYTLSRSDLDLVATRRGDANRLGFAVQLALLRYQGLALAQAEGEIGTEVYWMARRINI